MILHANLFCQVVLTNLFIGAPLNQDPFLNVINDLRHHYELVVRLHVQTTDIILENFHLLGLDDMYALPLAVYPVDLVGKRLLTVLGHLYFLLNRLL